MCRDNFNGRFEFRRSKYPRNCEISQSTMVGGPFCLKVLRKIGDVTDFKKNEDIEKCDV